MRIIFCGSGDFGIPTLRRLAAGANEIAQVITQPARPAGRGGQARPTPVALAAAELHLPLEAAGDINDPGAVAALAALKPDVMVVADFGQMIRPPARQAARLGAINLHGSLLPELRGAAPVNWAIIRGCRRTGVTTCALADRMDAGPMFCQKATDIGPDETADQLRARLAALGVEAVVETLAMLSAGPCAGQQQDESRATRAPLLKKADGIIDWSVQADTICNLIHGTWPWPAGQARYRSADAKELDVTIARARVVGEDAPALPPGAIAGDLTVAAGKGRVEIVEIKPAGRRLMPWRDFVNGYRVKAGAAFVPVGR